MARPKKDTEQYSKFSFNGNDYELSARQKLFCMEYIRNKFNGTQAALASGYSAKNAKVSAVQILSVIDVQRYIEALKNDIAFAIGVSSMDIAKEYAKIGFSDVRKIFDENGNLIRIKDIPDEPAANIASIEFIGNTKKVKFYDKVAALDKLAKMIGADGVIKVAQTDAEGHTLQTLSDEQFNKLLKEINETKTS